MTLKSYNNNPNNNIYFDEQQENSEIEPHGYSESLEYFNFAATSCGIGCSITTLIDQYHRISFRTTVKRTRKKWNATPVGCHIIFIAENGNLITLLVIIPHGGARV